MKEIYKNNIYVLIILITIVVLSDGCKKNKIPILTTSDITNITETTASSGGTVTSDGGTTVLSRGVCWSTKTTPSIDDNITSNGAGAGSFQSNITGLIGNTIYFVRAYATNSEGIAYGMALSFKTSPTFTTITTTIVSAITKTTAISGGSITNDGGANVTMSGVCWNSSHDPTIQNFKTTDGSGTGSFTSSITGLVGGTTYYVRAYATNSAGTAYGNEISLTTQPATLPVLFSTSVTNITVTNAVSGGNITDDGGAPIIAKGVCWSSSINPTIINNKTSNGTGIGAFTSTLTGLSGNTKYYLRAYATNTAGTAYGVELSFTTLVGLPTISTTVITSINNSAISGGNITNDGGAPVSVRGVCWGTSPNPSILNNISTDGAGAGIFISSISPLIDNTIYYVRAYATNIAGTEYGNQINFTTIPSLITTNVTSITSTSAISGGSINYGGGASIIQKGVCWGLSANPTIGDNKTTQGVLGGDFSSSLSNLTINTLYYIRAYATNAGGTAYGNEIIFSTSPYIIGQSYAGGKIFYIDDSGQHGLIAATSDQSSGAKWGCQGTLIEGADGTAIGTGFQNTIDILNGCSVSNTAAKICNDLVLNGYDDWYLPSKDELHKLYINRSEIGGFSVDYYWSSTESNTLYSWSEAFGGPEYIGRDSFHSVRAIRSF
jgi:hypothetical protein